MTTGIALKNSKKAYPKKDKFYNILLANHQISDKNYGHALKIRKAFKMHTMKDYHDLHQKVVVLLLAYVFDIFRKESIDLFELYPAHYLSTPCL